MTGKAVFEYLATCQKINGEIKLVPEIPAEFGYRIMKLALEITRNDYGLFWNYDKQQFIYQGDPEKRFEAMLHFLQTYNQIKELV